MRMEEREPQGFAEERRRAGGGMLLVPAESKFVLEGFLFLFSKDLAVVSPSDLRSQSPPMGLSPSTSGQRMPFDFQDQ